MSIGGSSAIGEGETVKKAKDQAATAMLHLSDAYQPKPGQQRFIERTMRPDNRTKKAIYRQANTTCRRKGLGAPTYVSIDQTEKNKNIGRMVICCAGNMVATGIGTDLDRAEIAAAKRMTDLLNNTECNNGNQSPKTITLH